MKGLLPSALSALTLASALALSATTADAQLQVQKAATLPSRIGQTTLPKDPLIRDATIGPATTVTGLPLADLVVKDSYLDNIGGFQGVNFLIANVGQADAGPFEVSIAFNYSTTSGVTGKWELYKVDGLKAGESKWVDAAPVCCGWSPTEFVVDHAVQFVVVADPKYMKADPFDPYNPNKAYEVKSQVPESNKGNNKFVINKADMRKSRFADMKKIEAAPPVGTVKTQTPVIKH